MGESFFFDDLLLVFINSGIMSDGVVFVFGNFVEDYVLNFLGVGLLVSLFCFYVVVEVFLWVVLLMVRVGEGLGNWFGEIDVFIV